MIKSVETKAGTNIKRHGNIALSCRARGREKSASIQ